MSSCFDGDVILVVIGEVVNFLFEQLAVVISYLVWIRTMASGFVLACGCEFSFWIGSIWS